MRASTTHTGRRVGVTLLVVIVAAMTLGVTGGIAGAKGAAAKGDATIVVKKPWARTSPMEATNGAVYLVLKNRGKSDDALVSASVSSSVAAEAQLHETVMGGTTDGSMGSTSTSMGGGMGGSPMSSPTSMGATTGTMTMREVEQIDLPAKSTVKLEPGGYHIMLMELAEPLTLGSTVKVTLEFEHGSTQTVKAVVKQ